MFADKFTDEEKQKEYDFVKRYPIRSNLLESLCVANNCQGGTIHQFLDIRAVNFYVFEKYFIDNCMKMSFRCETIDVFKRIAKHCNYNGLKF